jgi:hypothetical protein
MFIASGVRHAGLFTFAHSPKHLKLYQSFGFWPRFLTPLLLCPVSAMQKARGGWQRLSGLSDGDRQRAIGECRQITDAIYDGLDITLEIRSILVQKIGDIVLVGSDRIDAFAACHAGAGTEAGSGGCFVKFGAVRPGLGEKAFARLLDACEAFAVTAAAGHLEVGVNAGCHEAYRNLVERGFRASAVGVAMHRPNEAACNRPGIFVVGDWR